MTPQHEIEKHIDPALLKTAMIIINSWDGNGGAEVLSSRLVAGFIYTQRNLLSGSQIYYPGRDIKQERNAKIRAEFKGYNRDEICSRYQISQSTLYRIVNKKLTNRQ